MVFHSFGNRRKPPLIFLHGIGAGHRLWLRQIERFAQTHFVLAPDMPGLTGSADGAMPGIVEIANRIAARRGLQTLGPVAVCGISAGASVALALAAELRSRVGRLIVCAPHARYPRLLLGLQIAAASLMSQPALVVAAGREVRRDPEIAAAVAQDCSALGKRGLLSAMRALLAVDLREKLPCIAAPTWVLCGGNDRANLPAARTIATALPDARLCVEPGAGHLWNVQYPDRFNEVLSSALTHRAA